MARKGRDAGAAMPAVNHGLNEFVVDRIEFIALCKEVVKIQALEPAVLIELPRTCDHIA